MRRGLRENLGAREDEIIELRDANFVTLSKTMRSMNERTILNWAQGKKRTLVLFYYAGHGTMKNFTTVVCDVASSQYKVFYPLEK